MPEFDVESDPAFLRSLNDLGEDIADATIAHLFKVAARMSWAEFVDRHEWSEHKRQPIDTYPGAVDYWHFRVPMPDAIAKRQRDPRTHVLVFALNQLDELVLCAVAQ